MRKWMLGLPPLAGFLAAMLLAGDSSAQVKTPLPALALDKLRQKVNPEFPAWSPEQVFERVAEHLAVFQQNLIEVGGAATPEGLEEARLYAALQASYLVYFDLSDVPRSVLPQGNAALQFTANSASAAPFVYRLLPVPGSDNRLFYGNFQLLNWNTEVLDKIAEEDPYYREPLIPSDSKALLYVKSVIGNRVFRADWFIYYTGDTAEFLKVGEVKADNAFYYQLLYAGNHVVREVEEDVQVKKKVTEHVRKRFKYSNGQQTWWQDDLVPVEKEVVTTQRRKVSKKFFGKVPQDVKEFQQFWRVDTALKDAGDFFADRGAIVDEGRSQVSYSNRILQRVRTSLGTYWRSFDVFRTAGDQDYLEELPVPLQDGKKFKFDAGEHIFQDAKGNQVYFLSNGTAQGEARVEFGDPRVVRDQMSGGQLIVKTWKSCVACHDQGIIPLENEVKSLLKDGVRLNLRYDQVVQKQAFYLREINRLIAVDNAEYAEFVRECNGLLPQENARQYQRFRNWYWAPLTLAQAARECGAPPEELQDALSLSAKGRLGRMALTGATIPRTVWERGLYQEAFLLLITYRKSVNADRAGRGLPPVPLTTHAGPPLPPGLIERRP